MNHPSSHNNEFFDELEEISEKRKSEDESRNTLFFHSNSISPFKPAFSRGESESPYPEEQVPTIRFFLSLAKISFTTRKVLIEDVNITASRQGYIIVAKRREKRTKIDIFAK